MPERVGDKALRGEEEYIEAGVINVLAGTKWRFESTDPEGWYRFDSTVKKEDETITFEKATRVDLRKVTAKLLDT